MMTEPDFQIVAPHSAAWPRNSEGDIAVFPDGRWLLAWSAFYGGARDHSPAHIMGRWSHDKGETWGDPVMLLENDGGCNVISVSVKVYRDGTVGFAHSRTDDESCYYAWPFYRWSEDGGESWSAHEPMVDMETQFGFPCNGRLMELSSGRLVLPFQLNTRPPTTREGESLTHAAYSDDAGRTWKLSNPVAVRGATSDGIARRGADEPAAFERKDGTIMFLMRTRLGKIYAAESSDGGETVSESYDTGLDSPAAPCSAARVPATGDVVLVWNNSKPDAPGSGRPRAPLTAAVSRDDGRTWSNFKDIEPDTSRCYMYPVIVFDGDTALVLYSEGGYEGGPLTWDDTSLKLARIPYQWFYE